MNQSTKKAPNRCALFQVGYGQSLILTLCVVSNDPKIRKIKDDGIEARYIELLFLEKIK